MEKENKKESASVKESTRKKLTEKELEHVSGGRQSFRGGYRRSKI